MKPSAATTLSQASTRGSSSPLTVTTARSRTPSPSRAVTWALVIISTSIARTLSTLPACARNASRRCTRVTEAASGSSISAQSMALSPPPTMTTSRPTYSWLLGTK